MRPKQDYVALARALGDAGTPERMKLPAPTPPVAARPDRLPVTEIETWLRDPYAIYARRVLGLKAARSAGRGDRRRWSAAAPCTRRWSVSFRLRPGLLPDDAASQTLRHRRCGVRRTRHAESGAGAVAAALPARGIVVRRGRACAADGHPYLVHRDQGRMPDCGRLCTVRHRRPHRSPEQRRRARSSITRRARRRRPTQVKAFLAPQLPLEAAMLAAGGFAPIGKATAGNLFYLRFSGGRDPGKFQPVDITLVDEALNRLKQRIVEFADPDTPYRPRVKPYRADASGRLRSSGAGARMVADRAGRENEHARSLAHRLRSVAISAWVAANAGAGKTYTLANRVTRLLLADAKPEKILCLTFTKAAAAEMQDRLFKQLGRMVDAAGRGAARRTSHASAREPGVRGAVAQGAPAVRAGAGDAGRTEDPDHSRLLPDRAVALSARGRCARRRSTCWTNRPRAN